MTQRPLTTHAKVAPSLVRMPGLFLVTTSGPRRSFDVALETKDMRCRLNGYEQLSVGDLEVLLGLIALAGRQSDESYRTTKRLTGRYPVTRVRQMLGREIEVRTTCSELARELGRSAGGATWPFIKQSVARISRVSVFIESNCKTEAHSAPLLRPVQEHESKDTIALALCPLLSAGVLGGPGEFIQIDMNDFRSLQDMSGVSRALYFRLLGFYTDQDHLMPIDRLVGLAYGSSIPSDSRRKYRARVKAAAQAIAGLSQWRVKSCEGAGLSFRRSSKRKAGTTVASDPPINP